MIRNKLDDSRKRVKDIEELEAAGSRIIDYVFDNPHTLKARILIKLCAEFYQLTEEGK